MKIDGQEKIEGFMTRAPHSVGAEQTLEVARRMMLELAVRHLPVKKGGALVGILSDRDIEFALRVDSGSADRLTVEDACTSEVYIVGPETPVGEVAAKMAGDRLGCAVIEQGGSVLGIFTTTDACRALARCCGCA